MIFLLYIISFVMIFLFLFFSGSKGSLNQKGKLDIIAFIFAILSILIIIPIVIIGGWIQILWYIIYYIAISRISNRVVIKIRGF